ncbi:Tau-tubulin kinase 2 [Trichostrongylus colubriformis]|uniref:Tau-tubulin kinase 2 n=1 Tax=Trichostrongylus colubriformis TaxID=6319 RepID=A0AAN8J030_TRICO
MLPFYHKFRVAAEEDAMTYAMKCEEKKANMQESKLATETTILTQLHGRKHFTELIDVGDQGAFRFFIMELLGKNLSDLKKIVPSSVFSLATGLSVSLQCLDACRELHQIGYIHRDVKPSNFAIGRNHKRRIIHLLDFGISRKYGCKQTESVKFGRFKGTICYASLACHQTQLLGPRDDCESWLYMLADVISPMGLPWKNAVTNESVLRMKQDIRNGNQSMFLCGVKSKRVLIRVITYLDKLSCDDMADYTLLSNIIREAARTAKCDLSAPFDWESEPSTPARTPVGISPATKKSSRKHSARAVKKSAESTKKSAECVKKSAEIIKKSDSTSPMASAESIQEALPKKLSMEHAH